MLSITARALNSIGDYLDSALAWRDTEWHASYSWMRWVNDCLTGSTCVCTSLCIHVHLHRQHCEYSIVKWEIKLNKMSDKEGIKRYEGKRKQNKK